MTPTAFLDGIGARPFMVLKAPITSAGYWAMSSAEIPKLRMTLATSCVTVALLLGAEEGAVERAGSEGRASGVLASSCVGTEACAGICRVA